MHRGYCRKYNFYYNGHLLTNTNKFTYLGVVFTTRLCSTPHVNHIVSKCQAKIGFLFAKLHMTEIPLDVFLNIFKVYILSIVTHGLPTWFPNATISSKNKLNSLFTKYLKRYLGIPYCSKNAIVHYITKTQPLSQTLEELVDGAALKITYPYELDGIRPFRPRLESEIPTYDPIPEISPYFWLSEPIKELPLRQSQDVLSCIR